MIGLSKSIMHRIRGAIVAAGIALTAQGQDRLKFEVASIKPTVNDTGKGGLEILSGGGLRMGGVTLKQLISFAYGVHEERISGGPNWISSTSYNVLAKPENPHPADIGQTTFAPGTPGWTRVEQRLQSLLEERFQLVFHKDSKESSGYALVPAKGGVKLGSNLRESQDQGNASTMRSRGAINGRRGSMQMLSTVLGNMLGRPVEDRTGLAGTYDYKLEYPQEGPPSEISSDVRGVFSALQEQLGLKLESAKVTTTTIVVERAEKPTN
jgi:bla regulator protein blaR1